jgi:hypothetical protein
MPKARGTVSPGCAALVKIGANFIPKIKVIFQRNETRGAIAPTLN